MSPVTTRIFWLSFAPIEDWSKVKVIQAMANLVVTVDCLGGISRNRCISMQNIQMLICIVDCIVLIHMDNCAAFKCSLVDIMCFFCF